MSEPAPLVGVEVDDARWAAVGIEALAERAARATLTLSARDPDFHEISLLACDDARMAALNGEFRGKPQPTNVLSWPAFAGDVPEAAGLPGEGPLFIGDLALGYETCLREAEEAAITLADHASHLVVHGVLHLLGHDHGEEAEAELMESFETKVLASIGVANPYSP